MSSNTTKDRIIDTTMQLTSEVGLFGFSMKQVTNRVGVSESLLFKYYETKENLFLQCFLKVHGQIIELMESDIADNFQGGMNNGKKAVDAIHDAWVKYFNFLVENKYRTIFYFEYRDSSYISDFRRRRNGREELPLRKYIFSDKSRERFLKLKDGISPELFWVYLIDSTGIFAKRVIKGLSQHSAEHTEFLWRLMWRGLVGTFRDEPQLLAES